MACTKGLSKRGTVYVAFVGMYVSLGIGNLPAQQLTWIGTLGGSHSAAEAISADGSTVVGWSWTTSGYSSHAFRWNRFTLIMQDLGTLGGDYSWAYGVSADGSVVVGWSPPPNSSQHAFRWQNGVMTNLGTLGGYASQAYAVSANGSVVVGASATAQGSYRAFRWVEGIGMENLGALPDGNFSVARGVSADGSVVVGVSTNASGHYRAFRWTENEGMQDLGTLGGSESTATAVSADGTVVVGFSRNPAGAFRAVRWTQSGIEDLGDGEAYAVSANGSVIVGHSNNRAFRWTPRRGWEDLNVVYAHLLGGSVLNRAAGVSADGRYIVGQGYNAAIGRFEAFLLDTGPSCLSHQGDVNEDGCVDDADLLAVLFSFGQSGSELGREDVNCDSVVDDADLLIVLFNFGIGC